MVSFTAIVLGFAATAITGANAALCRYPYDNCGWVLASYGTSPPMFPPPSISPTPHRLHLRPAPGRGQHHRRQQDLRRPLQLRLGDGRHLVRRMVRRRWQVQHWCRSQRQLHSLEACFVRNEGAGGEVGREGEGGERGCGASIFLSYRYHLLAGQLFSTTSVSAAVCCAVMWVTWLPRKISWFGALLVLPMVTFLH